MKRFFALLLLAALLVSSAAAYDDGGYISDYASGSAARARSLGIMCGSNDGEYLFRPLDPVSRQEMCKIVFSMNNAGRREPSALYDMGVGAFSDSASISAWAKRYAGYCALNGFFIGDGSGSLRPNDGITYFEFSIVLLRMLGYSNTADLALRDGESASAWRARVTALGESVGLFDGTLFFASMQYNAALCRQDAAVMACNALDAETVTYVTTTNGGAYERDGTTLVARSYGAISAKTAKVVSALGKTYTLSGGLTVGSPDFGYAKALNVGREMTVVFCAANQAISVDWTDGGQ